MLVIYGNAIRTSLKLKEMIIDAECTYLLLRMPSSGMLCHVAPVRADVSEELSASIIRVTRIGELATLAVTSN
jgi:hypothetical protein